VVPDCLKRHTLEHNRDNEARSVTDHPAHGDFKDEPKAITGKYAEVDEEDGEFGKVLNEGIIYASDIVKLSTVNFYVANARRAEVVPFQVLLGLGLGRPRSASRSCDKRLRKI
jgi:hypothetical protein